MRISDFKFLTRVSKISFFPFIFRCIQGNICFQKVFYFSRVSVFIVCHLSKIYLQSERKAWFYLAQNFRFFISKILILFRKKRCSLKIAVPEFSIFLKSTCLLLVIFLKFIFNQKEKCCFIWPKTFKCFI